MSITTLDGIVAGAQWPRYFAKGITPTLVAGKPQSLWGLAGNPGAGTYDTTLAGVALSGTSAQVNGQVPFTDPVSGNTYLSRLQAAATQPGTLLLCDRLWHNGGFTITSATAQALTSATFPARDVNGSTNGDGVLVGLEISAAAGNAAPTLTLGYTNSAGGTLKTATNTFATANSPAAGSFFPFGLASGDIGVRQITSLQLSVSWVSGTMNLVAYRVLASLEITGAFTPNALDAITGGFARMYPGTVPFFIFIPSTTTATNVSGQVIWTQG
ncbi:hypothetical protein UFOVP153_2 [uncultured Caudovirales phage]|uniref:Uncharacterized protein n=1 Tax=uncultured Caudovirales phage TaxID=2100421 RepID=A0A6J5KZ52_9CAUD|nr:hypothetical protein UFOVP69_56 [uncultured Caudovirales phage]CAB5170112.1 hypothetical protein UFOVP153_2 [uncultured Caudovirales phage]